MAFESPSDHASHRVDLVVGAWLTALFVMAGLAWGGLAVTALAALYVRR
jgi:phosphatidylglycerophosphatase A